MVFFSINKDSSDGPCLIGVEGECQGRSITISDSLTIGRRKNNTLVLTDKSVSGFHAKIEKVDDLYEIEDLGSKNRTRLNGRKIFKRLELAHGDTIKIGISSFRFECLDSQPLPPNDVTVPIEKHEVPPPEYPPIIDPPFGPPVQTPKGGNKMIMLLNIIIVVMLVAGFAWWYIRPQPKREVDPKPRVNEITRQERLKEIWDNPIVKSESPNLQRARDLLDDAQHDFSRTVFDPTFKPDERWRSYYRCLQAESYSGNTPEFEILNNQITMLKKAIQSEIEFHENRCHNLYWINKDQRNWPRALEEIERIEILLDLKASNSESGLSRYYRIIRLEAEKKRDGK